MIYVSKNSEGPLWIVTRAAVVAFVSAAVGLCQPGTSAADKTAHLLSFDDLATFSDADAVPPPLRDRLEELLKSPVVNNDAALSGLQPHHPSVKDIGQVLRCLVEHRARPRI